MTINYTYLVNELKDLIYKLWESNLSLIALPKGQDDIVTETDLRFEKEIINKIKEITPNIPILSEETLSNTREEGTFYTIDPIDGTWNFANGIPIYGTQVALIENHNPTFGIIYLPTFHKMYSAIKGKGAYCNNQLIKVRATEIPKAMISITDFKKNSNILITQLKIAQEVTNTFGKPRMNGCTSYDLALVSEGGFQGKISYAPHLWDIAPGIIIIREAGGYVEFDKECCIAAASKEILDTLKIVLENALK